MEEVGRWKRTRFFVEAGHSQQEVAAKIAHAYDQLFHGDPETRLLFFPSGENENGPLAYIPDERHSPGLVATSGAASLAATNEERSARFTEALWSLEVPSSKVFRYYDGLLYMMSLLHVAGEFRIISPLPPESPGASPGSKR